MPTTERHVDALRACLIHDSVKQAAFTFGVGYDRMRHLLHELYRDLGVSTMAQAVAALDDRCPGWRSEAA